MDNSVSKLICLAFFVLALGIPSLAQNTKGDRSTPAPRETRFKTPGKAPKKARTPRRVRRQNDRPGKRAGAPPAPTRRRGERAGKPIGNVFARPDPDNRQRAWKGDISGRRIRPRAPAGRAHNVYPQPGTTNYSSLDLKRRRRLSQNPNVKRVRRMQQDDHGRPRVGKPIRPTFHKSRPREQQRAWKGDIAGRRLRTKRSDNVARQSRAVPGFAPSGRSRRASRGSIFPRNYSSRAKNTFFGQRFYVNNKSRRPTRFSDNPSLSLDPTRGRRRIKGGRIVPRSASASFRRNRSINTWAHFRKPNRPRLPFGRDLAGRKLRMRNYQTQRPVLGNPTWRYQRRVPGGDRAYKGVVGGFDSRTRTGRAWRGDIAHRAIRGGKPPRGDKPFLGFLKGGGFRSATLSGERRGKAIPGRAPGIGARGIGNFRGRIKAGQRGFDEQGEGYTGNIRMRRPGKGGGSISGERWNNNGMPIRSKAPGKGWRGIGYAGNIRVGHRGFREQGEAYEGNIRRGDRRGFNDQGEEYSGNIKAGRARKGGGSRSGHWNNNNRPIMVRIPRGEQGRAAGFQGNIKAGRRGFSDQGEEYTGNIKARRPEKGGGSVSGMWNNDGRAISPRHYSDHARINRYSGNIRAKRPEKGGGSISGMWNNDERPIAGRVYPNHSKMMRYTGNVKSRRPEKGGGSVSGKLWNNEERPIAGRVYPNHSKMMRYTGNIKAKRPDKGGGSVSGELWNNRETPIPGKDYSYAKKQSRYTGHFKVRKPDKDGNGAFGFSGDTKLARSDYRHNPRSADGAMRGRRASAPTREADVAVRGTRRSWQYVKNPSSADEAQRTREPGRAFASLSGFQGHMKVHRFDRSGKRGLHPDAQFVKLDKNNVPEERDLMTNFKLWWARLFRSNETQPEHLKDKPGKPRYDKGEAGLWYE